ncbi:apolipoprotein L1 [Archocentrus centrarchus]|uniref:apolipoprotein L1 n=1 Tax=Archocentrus centrarchus TaxID=63155 RepID=UPI0011EA4825|nr:uncharacterized protein LOC115795330 [Archocentrus centrarchus]
MILRRSVMEEGSLGKFKKSSISTEPSAQDKGVFKGMLKKTDKSAKEDHPQEDLSTSSKISGSNDNLSVKSNTKLLPPSATASLKVNFNTNEKEAGSDDDDATVKSEKPSGHKQKDTEDAESVKENEKQVEKKPKLVESKMNQYERRERSAAILVPSGETQEEVKGTSSHDKVKPRRTEDSKDDKDMTSRQKKGKPAESPAAPSRPSEVELNRVFRHSQQKQNQQGLSGDEGVKDESAAAKDAEDEKNPAEGQTAAYDDEKLNEDEESASKKEKNEEEGKEKRETKVKKKKKHNPFMPGVKARVVQRRAQEEAPKAAENEGANKCIFDQLEDYRIGPARAEDSDDVDLMEWWETVEQWKDMPQHEDMTEKEEAKTFALTAEKVQKGLRVFNKLFTERAESLWQHVIDLNRIADGLDKFNKNTKIAQITGGSTSAIGGIATVAGLALAPFTMGTSLIVTAVGLGIATAGGLTSAGAGISNQVNNTMDRKKVEKIVQDYQEKMEDLNKCLTFIKQGIENLRRFDLIKIKNSAYNQDFPALTSRFYEDGAMAGKAILINANEIMRFVQIANVAGTTAARAVQIASMATGVLTGLFVVMDIYFVSEDSKELKKGAKSEFAAKIREVAQQLHDGLVELNSIRQELQFT